MIKDNQYNLLPFRAGDPVSAGKLNVLLEALKNQSKYTTKSGVQGTGGTTSNYRNHFTTRPLKFRNNAGTALLPNSIFTVDKSVSTSISGGMTSHPHLVADKVNIGLTYYTNDGHGVGPSSPFQARNISSVWPARIRYTGAAPVLGEECGPAFDGTGAISNDGRGFVCVQHPDTTNQVVWVQAIGGGALALHVGKILDNVSHCSTVQFQPWKRTATSGGAPDCGSVSSGEPTFTVLNMTGIFLTTGAFYFAIECLRFNIPLLFPEQIAECLETLIGPDNQP
jgi:hypothetical protein